MEIKPLARTESTVRHSNVGAIDIACRFGSTLYEAPALAHQMLPNPLRQMDPASILGADDVDAWAISPDLACL